MLPLFMNQRGPGVRNYLKGVRGRWSSEVVADRKGTLRRIRTFTSVVTGTLPHQGKREVARRLRKAA